MTLASLRLSRAFTLACLTIAALGLSGGVVAQTDNAEPAAWAELEVPPPDKFSTDNLQTFELGQSSALTYGIDPNSLTVGSDGVVRYVLVVKSGRGALNALYQGLRCSTAEVKTYARWDNRASWNTDTKDAWLPLSPKGFTQPSLVLARSGICEGRTINGTPQNILRTLKNGRPYSG